MRIAILETIPLDRELGDPQMVLQLPDIANYQAIPATQLAKPKDGSQREQKGARTMRRITLYPYENRNRCRAYIEPEGIAADAWPVRRYTEGGRDILEAVVVLPDEPTQTYRFLHDGTNWVAEGMPIARVRAVDLSV